MRWTTYKKEIRKLKKKNKNAAKAQKYGRWHKWWAWHTVQLGEYVYVRWEYVQRRGCFDHLHNWIWQYKAIIPSLQESISPYKEVMRVKKSVEDTRPS